MLAVWVDSTSTLSILIPNDPEPISFTVPSDKATVISPVIFLTANSSSGFIAAEVYIFEFTANSLIGSTKTSACSINIDWSTTLTKAGPLSAIIAVSSSTFIDFIVFSSTFKPIFFACAVARSALVFFNIVISSSSFVICLSNSGLFLLNSFTSSVNIWTSAINCVCWVLRGLISRSKAFSLVFNSDKTDCKSASIFPLNSFFWFNSIVFSSICFWIEFFAEANLSIAKFIGLISSRVFEIFNSFALNNSSFFLTSSPMLVISTCIFSVDELIFSISFSKLAISFEMLSFNDAAELISSFKESISLSKFFIKDESFLFEKTLLSSLATSFCSVGVNFSIFSIIDPW